MSAFVSGQVVRACRGRQVTKQYASFIFNEHRHYDA